ncbi:MAG: hypothetical protein NTX15_05765 [Candidatus Kapabacteria bacterium]|nr:hypothetical protein [Candidatus Kapabacteria bacterium]
MKTLLPFSCPFAFLFALLLLLGTPLSAQISISDGTSTDGPNQDAAFEVSSSTQGVLLPRLKLVATDSPKPLKKFSAGMIIYNLSTTSGETGVTPGLYYCDGEHWVPARGSNVVQTLVAPPTPPNRNLRGVYHPPGECRTFDIEVNADIPETAVVLLTLEHAGENPTCLSIRQIDRVRGVISSQMLPTFARIHWLILE